MPQIPRKVRDALLEFHRIAAAVPLWPGFQPERTPLVLHGPEVAYLVGHPAPPDDYAQLEPVLGRTVHAGPRHPEMTANTSAEICGVLSALAELPGESEEPDRYARLLLHECFHVFQTEGLGALPRPDVRYMTFYPENDPVNNALAVVENRLLAAALAGDCRAPAAFLAVRGHRQERLDEGVRVYEVRQEYNEGTPTYIEMRAGMNLADLTGRLSECSIGGKWAGNRRFYYTGAAIALLLDRLAPGWHQSFAHGQGSLQARLAEVAGPLPPAADVLAQIGYTEIAAEERQREVERGLRIEGLLSALNTDGEGCRVEFAIDRAPWCGWDPTNVMVVRPGLRLHLRFFAAYGPQIRIQYEGLCLEDRERQVAIVRLPAPPRVTSDSPFQFEGKGLHGEAPAGRLERDEQGWRIQIFD
ncbi:MAG TPA: hypothetical protein VNT01_12890 [Symbiobacteriaceae bacterium]|nr:hypothetical protein [Symbiobacteriaceae bacterium]